MSDAIEVLFDSNTREERVIKLLKAYEIFLFQHKKVNVVDAEDNLEFCRRYKNAINEVFQK